MPQEPTVTVLPRGVSGYPEGTPLFQPKMRGPARAKGKKPAVDTELEKRQEYARRYRAKHREKARTSSRENYRRRRERETGSPVVPRIGAPVAPPIPSPTLEPGSLAAKPGRDGRLRACIEELTVERDSLTVIIEHLERLVS